MLAEVKSKKDVNDFTEDESVDYIENNSSSFSIEKPYSVGFDLSTSVVIKVDSSGVVNFKINERDLMVALTKAVSMIASVKEVKC